MARRGIQHGYVLLPETGGGGLMYPEPIRQEVDYNVPSWRIGGAVKQKCAKKNRSSDGVTARSENASEKRMIQMI